MIYEFNLVYRNVETLLTKEAGVTEQIKSRYLRDHYRRRTSWYMWQWIVISTTCRHVATIIIITIVASPLGTIDVGTGRNKFNFNFNITDQHCGRKGLQLLPCPLENARKLESFK